MLREAARPVQRTTDFLITLHLFGHGHLSALLEVPWSMISFWELK